IGCIPANIVIAVALHLTAVQGLPAGAVAGDGRLADTNDRALVRGDTDSIVADHGIAHHHRRGVGTDAIGVVARDEVGDGDAGARPRSENTDTVSGRV